MKIGLLGHGVVGSGVRQIIDGRGSEALRGLEVVKILVKDQSEICDPRMTLSAREILEDPEIGAVAECMGGLEPAHSFVHQALESGKSAVTSNKKMMASFYEDLSTAAKAHHVRILYEASAGGGIPWMHELGRVRRIDEVQSFSGIFNGTTNYILSRMHDEGKEFDELLKEAQKLGYAERDPGDDIDGLDVRYKVCLSCAKAFGRITEPAAIPAYGIRSIRREDIAWGAANGLSVKLIGSGQVQNNILSASVLPAFIPDKEVLAHIPLNFNALESVSPTLGPAVFIGQGAGSLPTAHAVVQDLLNLAQGSDDWIGEEKKSAVDNRARRGVYYVRTARPEAFASVIGRPITQHSFLSTQTALTQMEKLVHDAQDPELFLAEVKK